MDRRTFLLTTSVAAGCLAASRDAGAGQFTGKIKKAVKFHMASGDASVEDKFRLVKDLGFDGIETRIALGDDKKALVKSYADASEKTGLPIHGTIHSSNPDLIGAIDQAKSLGANSVLHVVRYDQKIGYMQNYNETQAIIRKALAHAEKQQVMILLTRLLVSMLNGKLIIPLPCKDV